MPDSMRLPRTLIRGHLCLLNLLNLPNLLNPAHHELRIKPAMTGLSQ